MRSAGEPPARAGQVLGQQVRSCFDESLGVECDAALQPVRTGHGAGHSENVPDAVCLDAPALAVAPAHLLEVTVPLEAHYLRPPMSDDGWMIFDATDQVARHGVGQARPA